MGNGISIEFGSTSIRFGCVVVPPSKGASSEDVGELKATQGIRVLTASRNSHDIPDVAEEDNYNSNQNIGSSSSSDGHFSSVLDSAYTTVVDDTGSFSIDEEICKQQRTATHGILDSAPTSTMRTKRIPPSELQAENSLSRVSSPTKQELHSQDTEHAKRYDGQLPYRGSEICETWSDLQMNSSKVSFSHQSSTLMQPFTSKGTPRSHSRTSIRENQLLTYLCLLSDKYEIICEVLTIPTTSTVSQPFRCYLWSLPRDSISVAINLAIPFLPKESSTTLVVAGNDKLPTEIQELFNNGTLSQLQIDEVSCIATAIDFLKEHCPEGVFSYDRTSRVINEVADDSNVENYAEKTLSEDERANFYPYLLINLKAGVTFFKVCHPQKIIRIGGSTIGGATFMGLDRLLVEDKQTPEEAILSAVQGDNRTCDMLVADIYGGSYSTLNLPGNIIASTFGKLQTHQALDHAELKNPEKLGGYLGDMHGFTKSSTSTGKPSDSDVTLSLLKMMSFNVMQQAYLNSIIHEIHRIVLVGFLINVPTFLAAIQHSINFWSKGVSKAQFVKVFPFLATLGAAIHQFDAASLRQIFTSSAPADKHQKLVIRSYLLDGRRRIRIREHINGSYVTREGATLPSQHSASLL